MIKKAGELTIEGMIVEVRDGQKQIRRNYTYGYRSLRVRVGVEYYSVLINTTKLNEYGFLPKVGQWIRVTGRLSKAKEGQFDPSISWVSHFEHIEPIKKSRGGIVMAITTKRILDALTHQWQSLAQIAEELEVVDDSDKEYLKSKLKIFLKRGVISEFSKRGKLFWRK